MSVIRGVSSLREGEPDVLNNSEEGDSAESVCHRPSHAREREVGKEVGK